MLIIIKSSEGKYSFSKEYISQKTKQTTIKLLILKFKYKPIFLKKMKLVQIKLHLY